LRKGNLADYEWEQLTSKITRLTDAPIYIDDTPALSIFELRAKCRRLKAQKNIQMIIIDYLQLMTSQTDNRGGNREQEISTISRSLKSIAKELEVPVIALSQLSREVEKRGGDKRPLLSDLRESGAIEQDADMVAFIYRPEYYNITQDEQGQPLEGVAEIIMAKHRNGSTGTVKLKFIKKLARFSDLDGNEYFDDSIVTEITDSSNTIIRESRMNNMDDDAPF
jgi:replicative DNA helicase